MSHVQTPQNRLLNTGKLSVHQRLWMELQIARGLEYLASKGVVHRDVAARNVLLSDPTPQTNGYDGACPLQLLVYVT